MHGHLQGICQVTAQALGLVELSLAPLGSI
jgi:hypothetical protein